MANRKEFIKVLIDSGDDERDYDELMEILIDEKVAIDPDKDFSNLSLGDRLADRLTEIAGSWGFIVGFLVFMFLWILLNIFILRKFDPYPFILLNLLLSCLAALQAPIIMMSQNRQSKKDSLRSRNDYRTDLKSELILEQLHDRQEELMKNQRKILQFIDDYIKNDRGKN